MFIAPAKAGIFFKQALLNVEAKVVSFMIAKAFLYLGKRIFIDLAVGKEDVVRVLPRYSGFAAISSSGQTSSTLKRFENSTSCHRSDFDSPGGAICSRQN